ncbi:acetylcholine receptor subunit alpha-type acr-16-like [Teleopsis dalmanni]|uniref:acetylcholine receptor subunit alpha-type acr-16-like n=1 Tax=Teleopsis dalmanni TaxID=139649 RepID=UPI0018CE89B0|nr:acetylcholine receptor subunit alpha-type acr-16-like [Teleopsis dalmanni]
MFNIKYLYAIICTLLIAEVLEAKFYSKAIAQTRLISDLLTDYDSGARPAPKDTRIDVCVNLTLQHFDFREQDGAFNFLGRLDMKWHDQKLKWDPKDYNYLTQVPVKQAAIWVPDLEIYNNVPDKFLRLHENGMIILENTGDVFWSSNIEMVAYCSTNMRDWPHDKHFCKLSLGSWTYHGLEVDVIHSKPNASMKFESFEGKQNMQYKVTDFHAEHVSTVYACCTEPYITMDYHITFERQASFAIVFRMPAICIIILTLLSLSMEPWRSEKIWLNGVSFIIITFNLIYFAFKVGKFARRTPLIVVFYSWSLVLVTLASLISVFTLFATRSRLRPRMPRRIVALLKMPLIQLMIPKNWSYEKHEHTTEVDAQHFEDVKLQESSNLINDDNAPYQWIQLAIIVERFTLVVFALIFLILGSTCFV